MRLAVFNEIPGTYAGPSRPPALFPVSVRAPVWKAWDKSECFNYLFLLKKTIAFQSSTQPCRLCLPRRSNAEIFIGCLFSFFPRRKKKDILQFSKQSKLCVWLKFHICDTLQSVWVSHHREGEGAVFGLRFIGGDCERRDASSFISS